MEERIMCKYKKWEKIQVHDLYLEGNHGGDFLSIKDVDEKGEPLPEGMINVQVGSCCVHIFHAIMPVDVLVAFITEGSDYGKIQQSINRHWRSPYAEEMMEQVRYVGR